MKILNKAINLLPPKLATIIRFEIGTYQSFWRLLSNRKVLKFKRSQKLVFSYSEMQNGILWMFQFASICEIVAIELLVSNEKLRLTLLVLGIWSVLLILGIWASAKTNPHEIDEKTIYIRQGTLYEITIPKAIIKEIAQLNSREFSKCRLIEGSLYLPVMYETNMKITLHDSIPCKLPWGLSGEIDCIYFYLDSVAENKKFFV